MNSLLFWIILFGLIYLGYLIGRSASVRTQATAAVRPPKPTVPPETVARFHEELAPFLAISWQRSMGNLIEFAGQLRGRSEVVFKQIRKALAPEDVTPMLLEGEGDEVHLILMPGKQGTSAVEHPRWWLHGLLLLATLATTTWAGALQEGVNLLQHPAMFAVGLPYSLGLMLILGAHEMGHYLTALHYRIRVTPPFFIPVPFALGTFGAFIKIKSQTETRRSLFDVAVAGPLAGLVFAVPALLIGLHYSKIVPGNPPGELVPGGLDIGSSVMMAFLSHLALGATIHEGHRLLLHPLAFAGWLGLLVTALNLLPIGQLDGGHMAHALFGPRKAHVISVIALVTLFMLALFVWPGLMIWAFIVFFIAGTRDAPTANDVTPVSLPRRLLGYFAFLLLLAILVPVPHALHDVVGIHSPYM